MYNIKCYECDKQLIHNNRYDGTGIFNFYCINKHCYLGIYENKIFKYSLYNDQFKLYGDLNGACIDSKNAKAIKIPSITLSINNFNYDVNKLFKYFKMIYDYI